MADFRLPILLLLGLSAMGPGAQSLESTYRTAGPAVHAAFDSVRDVLQTSSAVFQRGRREVIFGTVVSADGHILTKASELGELEDLTVLVDREAYTHPRLLAEDPAWDVALVKIEASNLVPVRWSTIDEAPQGTWVVTNGATTRRQRRVQVGVVAANEREVFAKGGTVLGVELDPDAEGLRVAGVTEGSGAEAAGMESGDRIVAVGGREIASREELLKDLKERRVGERVTIRVRRGEQTIDLEVELAGRAELFGEEQTRNDAMSGEFSERRTGFPRVMQHDAMANKHYMGGPVLNLEGECIGVNIARFSRCETYAIPSLEAAELVKRLMDEPALR